uniref:Pectinesterase inhibitor domain-containing protein n=1 Tax=Fagus sylvatica TaxID=28930 RepID=A0A2N9FU97_FAGSY
MGCFPLFSTLTLLVASLLISPSLGVTPDVLATICSQTQNQETCENILTSDQRTSSADLPTLSLISLDLTTKQASDNYNSFTQFHDNATDVSVKNGFDNCLRLYQDMQDKLKAAYTLSQQRKYKDITELGQLTTLAYNCENGLPSDSPTAAITEDMLLTSQTAASVNAYIASSFV